VERAEEWLVMLKLPQTAMTSWPPCSRTAQLRRTEIIAIPIVRGADSYLSWMTEETRPVGPAQLTRWAQRIAAATADR